MWSNRQFLLFYLMITFVIIDLGETRNCIPNQLIRLTNCSFLSSSSSSSLLHLTTNDDNRTLTMIVPYPFNSNDQDNLSITILTSKKSFKPLIRFHLNMIQCTEKNSSLNWTSLESSSTLHGEFVRTNHIERNIMYLPSGTTYLKNLTALDCSSKTLYRTDDEQLFQLNLKIESTLMDSCTNDQSCYPKEHYQCHSTTNRCQCRKPFQNYLIENQYSICLQAVQTMEQCPTKTSRCLEWCRQNSSMTMCLCPMEYSTKKFSADNQAYCESRIGGICNAWIQCPIDAICIRGICQNRIDQSTSLDIVTISIIVSCLVLFLISILLVISIYILRRQRWKKHHHGPIDSLGPEEIMTPRKRSDYDNVTYDALRKKNMKFSSQDDDDRSPMTTSDDCSYEPKIVYLGGEEQLTAIFA